MGDIRIEDLLKCIPNTRAQFAYAGDPLVYLQTAFEAVAKEAAEDALKGPPGAERHLFIQPQGGAGGEWLHIGPADGVPAGDLRASLADFEDEEGVEFDVRPMTQEEVDALPEFDGW